MQLIYVNLPSVRISHIGAAISGKKPEFESNRNQETAFLSALG